MNKQLDLHNYEGRLRAVCGYISFWEEAEI